MATILNIETSTTVCSVALAREGQLLALVESDLPNQHATCLTLFIRQALKESGLTMSGLDAVAVSSGPGSYTGLRIGYATTKGICYAIGKPLIIVDTLAALALGCWQQHPDAHLVCPMIDARRMEVYTTLLDKTLCPILPTQALILDEQGIQPFLEQGDPVFFCGNGAFKMREIPENPSLCIKESKCSAKNMIELSYQSYKNAIFGDVAYSTPLYLKAPNITQAKKQL